MNMEQVYQRPCQEEFLERIVVGHVLHHEAEVVLGGEVAAKGGVAVLVVGGVAECARGDAGRLVPGHGIKTGFCEIERDWIPGL
jgi:hypothetical protein